MTQRMFSSESVTCGHPDSTYAISDAIVDACLAIGKNARVAVETCIKGNARKEVIVLAGEVSLDGQAPDYVAIARQAAADIGYTSHDIGMDATEPSVGCWFMLQRSRRTSTKVLTVTTLNLKEQAYQGLMFGFACDETEAYDELEGDISPPSSFPTSLASVGESFEKTIPCSGSSGWKNAGAIKAYNEDGSVLGVDTVVIAIQHDKHLKDKFGGSIEAELEHVRESIMKEVVEVTIPKELLLGDYKLIVNGTGRFADPRVVLMLMRD